ncbi:hypothetical protein [Nocardiopsis sp. MG754419]|uniref:hypothetical protein n=1 Tax=Nocardiopsis sp. MG754419 TaxID=2259865 RepID=UPI001BAC306F|nr:hypothetical protein [Nocardiopsis sp. MG754419]MBR8744423.1 hypothetical protein [Nocardiopsis sp. MG754419]
MSDHMTTPQTAPAAERPLIGSPTARYVFAVTRISLGWVFLWAFFDKLLGLGFSTPTEAAWINGGSPTGGFLTHAVSGPFAGTFHTIAGTFWADPLFMAGMAGIGAALILGVGERIAAASGALMMILMWAAVLPLENNPFMDDHIVYALVLVGLALVRSADTLGLGRRWGATAVVRRFPALR